MSTIPKIASYYLPQIPLMIGINSAIGAKDPVSKQRRFAHLTGSGGLAGYTYAVVLYPLEQIQEAKRNQKLPQPLTGLSIKKFITSDGSRMKREFPDFQGRMAIKGAAVGVIWFGADQTYKKWTKVDL